MHDGSYKEWPRWANRVVLWIGIPTGILLALVAFFGAAKDFGGYMRGGCEAVGRHMCGREAHTSDDSELHGGVGGWRP